MACAGSHAGAQTITTSGLQLWMKADAGYSAGSSSCQWTDQSGNKIIASQSGASCPTYRTNVVNGQPAVFFNGTSQHLDFALNIDQLQGLTMIMVASAGADNTSSWAGVDNAPLMWGEYSSWGSVYLTPFQSDVQYRFGTGEVRNNQMWTRPATVGSKFTVAEAVKSGTAEQLYVGGKLVFSRTAPKPGVSGISASGHLGMGNKYFNGAIAEILVYSRALPDPERQAVEKYLNAKYGTGGPPTNQPPVVNAGPAQSITLPAAASLTGTATDDGLPAGSTLAASWSMASGPGTVTFANASALSTTATFSTSGSYALKLTASDGQLSSSSTVTITVNSQTTPPGIQIYPGTDIQSVVNANPEGTAFVLMPGVFRMQQITPKNGNSFTGMAGTILSGARLLSTFNFDGHLYYVTGQTQQGQLSPGQCDANHPMCLYPEDLYFDNAPLLHVGSYNQVGPGSWYFDYANNIIYFYDNPNGHAVETSVTRYAFTGSASNVTVQNLVVEKFASPAQQGAVGGVQTPSPGWIIQNDEVRLNHGLGIKVGDSGKVLNNFVHHNGQMGINTSGGNNIVIQGNEISYSNWAGYDMGWEAGGAKFWATQNLQVLNNYSHDNQGAGLWTDTDNIYTTYEGNTIANNAGTGLSHEVSYNCIIRNNTVSGNGGSGQNWLWGAQIQLQNSQNCQVYNNTVTVNAAGGNGIAVIQQNRGSGAYGPYLGINNTVHNNTITHLGSMGANGGVADWNQPQMFSGNNTFDYNTYHVANINYRYWAWNNGWWTWSQAPSQGIETHSTVDTNIP